MGRVGAPEYSRCDATATGDAHRLLQDRFHRAPGPVVAPTTRRSNSTAVLYPLAGRPVTEHASHSALAFQELHWSGSHLPYWYRDSPEFAAFKDATAPPARESMAAEIAATDADTIVVSSEEFVRFGSAQGVPFEQASEMVRALGVDQVTIICYLRRPDRYLESWYNQLVKLAVPLARLVRQHEGRCRAQAPLLRDGAHRLRPDDRLLGSERSAVTTSSCAITTTSTTGPSSTTSASPSAAGDRHRGRAARSAPTRGSTTTSSSTCGCGRCSGRGRTTPRYTPCSPRWPNMPHLPRCSTSDVLDAASTAPPLRLLDAGQRAAAAR